MPLTDILAAALSRPAAKVVDAPVRDLIHEVLADHAYASPAELRAVEDRARALGAKAEGLTGRLDAAEAALAALEERVAALDAALEAERRRARIAEEALAAAQAAVAEAAVEAPAAPESVVGPKGEVTVDGVAYTVSAEHAGRAYTVSGQKVRRVYIDGRAVRKARA